MKINLVWQVERDNFITARKNKVKLAYRYITTYCRPYQSNNWDKQYKVPEFLTGKHHKCNFSYEIWLNLGELIILQNERTTWVLELTFFSCLSRRGRYKIQQKLPQISWKRIQKLRKENYTESQQNSNAKKYPPEENYFSGYILSSVDMTQSTEVTQ